METIQITIVALDDIVLSIDGMDSEEWLMATATTLQESMNANREELIRAQIDFMIYGYSEARITL